MKRHLLGPLLAMLLLASICGLSQSRPAASFQGTFSLYRTYEAGDIVLLSGITYISQASGNLGHSPDSGLTQFWIPLAGTSSSSGTAGPAGPQGTTGPQGPIGLTGATGPQGPQGVTGATGATGAQGSAGANGNSFTTVSAVPSSSSGQNGDSVELPSGEIYKKVSGAWVDTGENLTGPAGSGGASANPAANAAMQWQEGSGGDGSCPTPAVGSILDCIVFLADQGGTPVAITGYSVSGNVVTITAANSLAAAKIVGFSGLGSATFLNGLWFTVLNPTGTSFQVNLAAIGLSHADVASSSDSGTATPGSAITKRSTNGGSYAIPYDLPGAALAAQAAAESASLANSSTNPLAEIAAAGSAAQASARGYLGLGSAALLVNGSRSNATPLALNQSFVWESAYAYTIATASTYTVNLLSNGTVEQLTLGANSVIFSVTGNSAGLSDVDLRFCEPPTGSTTYTFTLDSSFLFPNGAPTLASSVGQCTEVWGRVWKGSQLAVKGWMTYAQ